MWLYTKQQVRSFGTWKMLGTLLVGICTWIFTFFQLDWKTLMNKFFTAEQQSAILLPMTLLVIFLGIKLVEKNVRHKMADLSESKYFSMDVFAEDKEMYWKTLRPLIDDQSGFNLQKTKETLESQFSEKERNSWKNKMEKLDLKYKQLEERNYREEKGTYKVLQDLIIMYYTQITATSRIVLHTNEKLKSNFPLQLNDLDIIGAYDVYVLNGERLTLIQSVKTNEVVNKRKQLELETEVLVMREKEKHNSYRKNKLILLFEKKNISYVMEIHIKEFIHLFKKDSQQYAVEFIYNQLNMLLEIIENNPK